LCDQDVRGARVGCERDRWPIYGEDAMVGQLVGIGVGMNKVGVGIGMGVGMVVWGCELVLGSGLRSGCELVLVLGLEGLWSGGGFHSRGGEGPTNHPRVLSSVGIIIA
jgi:hypothetical protein